MTENKQYITQAQEDGAVMISEEVIATIAEQALEGVDGVIGLSSRPGSDIAELIGKNWGKGLKINISTDDTLTVECNIVVAYGQSVATVAEAVQNAVTNAIESMTGVKAAAVDVNVCEIVRQ